MVLQESLSSLFKLFYQLNDIELFYFNMYLNNFIFDIEYPLSNLNIPKYDLADPDPKINSLQILNYLNNLIIDKNLDLVSEDSPLFNIYQLLYFNLIHIIKEINYKRYPDKYIIVKINHKDYFITKHISSGMNASVYLAIDLEDNQLVALKLINILDPFFETDSLNREVMCLKLFKDICKKLFLCYVDSGYSKINHIPYYVIITEYLQGYQTLFDFKTNNNPSFKDMNFIDNQIIKSILELKKLGISHNDLHLKNILIHPSNFDIKIIDFGSCIKSPSVSYYFTTLKDILYLNTTKNKLIKYLSK